MKALRHGSGMEVDDKDEEDDTEMEEGSGPFKDKVTGILEEHGFADKRSAKMTQDDFLQLLTVFNQNGIHFA